MTTPWAMRLEMERAALRKMNEAFDSMEERLLAMYGPDESMAETFDRGSGPMIVYFETTRKNGNGKHIKAFAYLHVTQSNLGIVRGEWVWNQDRASRFKTIDAARTCMRRLHINWPKHIRAGAKIGRYIVENDQ